MTEAIITLIHENNVMKKMLLPALTFIFSFPMLGCAASFDCTKASSTTEKMICGDEAISKLDEQLASSYKKALEASTDKEAFKKTQIDWLKQQRGCKEIECLAKTYQQRIDELNQTAVAKVANSHAKPVAFTLVKGQQNSLCKDYVDMLNATKYPDLQSLACERKNLPEFKEFSSLTWTEITDKVEMEKIVRERLAVNASLNPAVDASVYSPNFDINLIKKNKLQVFFYKKDINNDGIIDVIYKTHGNPRIENKAENLCEYIDGFFVEDSQITIDSKNIPTFDPYSLMNSRNDLFLYNNNLYFSRWEGNFYYQSNLDVYAIGDKKICGIVAK